MKEPFVNCHNCYKPLGIPGEVYCYTCSLEGHNDRCRFCRSILVQKEVFPSSPEEANGPVYDWFCPLECFEDMEDVQRLGNIAIQAIMSINDPNLKKEMIKVEIEIAYKEGQKNILEQEINKKL